MYYGVDTMMGGGDFFDAQSNIFRDSRGKTMKIKLAATPAEI
jgi:hypothetical protein